MNRRCRFAAASILILVATIATGANQPTQQQQPMNAAEIELGLRRLGVVGNVLYVAAHPDDENTALLAWLANERLVRTGYLSMTRGDGGQNLIGDEKGELLGVIRTQELLAARRVDGAEQFFTRALDFSFSKNPEETLSIWNHDEILSDVVRMIRKFQPDVIITRFPITGEGGHGHHTASAILAEEAFAAAADPNRFPEQLGELKPWQATRLFWNNWLPQNESAPPPDSKLLAIDVGGYNAESGREYTELAAQSRTMHKSQGFGTEAKRGRVLNYLTLRKGSAASTDLLEGVDLTWSRIAGGAAVQKMIDAALQHFDLRHPANIVPELLEIDAAMQRLGDEPHVVEKRGELATLIRAASGLWLEAIAERPVYAEGETVKVRAMAVERTALPVPVALEKIRVRRSTDDSTVTESTPSAAAAQTNVPLREELSFAVSAMPVSAPYWLVDPPVAEAGKPAGRFAVSDVKKIGDAENRPPYEAVFTLRFGSARVELVTPVLYRWTDRVRGEQYRVAAIAPPVTARFDEKVELFAHRAPRDVAVHVTNNTTATRDASVRIVAPEGWSVTPADTKLTLPPRAADVVATFRATPPQSDSVATLSVDLRSADQHDPAARSFLTIDYPHIPVQTLFPVASARLVRADVRHVGSSIGYIAGSGDEVPRALEELGYTVHLLSDREIADGTLAGFDAIVVGVRAFNVRDAARNGIDKLLEWVRAGGTLVVQYNTVDDTLAPKLGPYPFKLTNDRVTVETAPITLLTPDDPLLTTPNRITAADFEGWVNERGLYFATSWDPHYRTILSSHDPGEKELAGGLLATDYGKGVYIETGLSFFRELPAGVPGAYRLFANLVSARQGKRRAGL